MKMRAIMFWAICLLGSACALWAQTPVQVGPQSVAQSTLTSRAADLGR
jgi:hypothetical protein